MDKYTSRKFYNKKSLKIIWFIYALCSIVLVLYLLDAMFSKNLTDKQKKIILHDGWTVSINEKLYKDVVLDELHFKPTRKGDKVVLVKTLPKEWKFKEAAMCFHIRQTTVDMFVDNKKIYTYGHKRLKNNDTVGSGVQLVNFSNDNKGKELRIILEVSEDNAFSKFDDIWISEWSDAYKLVLAENRLPFFLGAFLVVLGIVVTSILIFVVASSKKYTNILLLAIFAICMGIWTLCYHNVLTLFPVTVASISLIEYMALFIAPLPIIGYMHSYVKQTENRKIMLLYRMLGVIQFVFTIVSIGLHAMDIVHAASMLPYYHILVVIYSMFFAYVLYACTKKNKNRRKFYTIGLVIALICIVYELVNYVLGRYFGINVLEIKGVLSLGIIVVIVILVLDLYHDITIKKMEEHERNLLIKHAYTDDLTKLNNRRYCTEYMQKLDSDKESKYTIISFDLNDLKKVNDINGHVKGDLLIKKAAEILDEIFSPLGIIGRMGGDEFVSIIDTEDTKLVESLLEELQQSIDKNNKIMKDMELSISYGYAMRCEIKENMIQKVYQLSDDRMYENKRIYKQQYEK